MLVIPKWAAQKPLRLKVCSAPGDHDAGVQMSSSRAEQEDVRVTGFSFQYQLIYKQRWEMRPEPLQPKLKNRRLLPVVSFICLFIYLFFCLFFLSNFEPF